MLRPAGVSVWVCKDYVRENRRVPFCRDWAKLLVSCGFVVLRRARAMLVNREAQPDLFGGVAERVTERKSFFRRLNERKGAPRIDWEEVIYAVKLPTEQQLRAVGVLPDSPNVAGFSVRQQGFDSPRG